MTTKHEIIALHNACPNITVREAADHLGCGREQVTATCMREGIRFAPYVPIVIPDRLRHSVNYLEKGLKQ